MPDPTFAILCRHRGSFIFPIIISAPTQIRARDIFHAANELIDNQIIPTFCFEINPESAYPEHTMNMRHWLGSVPFADFDSYLQDWLGVLLLQHLTSYAHHAVRLERMRGGEVIRDKKRVGTKVCVTILSEAEILSSIESALQCVRKKTQAQVFAEALKHGFDFDSELEHLIAHYVVRERDMVRRGREALANKARSKNASI